MGVYGTAPGTETLFTPSGIDIDSGPSSPESNALRVTRVAGPSFQINPPINTDALFVENELTGFTGELNYQMESGLFTLVTGIREYEQDYAFVGPAFSPAPTQEEGEQVSIEARFATDFEGPFNAVVGAYYFDEEVDFDANFNTVAVAPVQNFTSEGDSWAVFGQATFELTESARINLGARFTEDNKSVSGDDYTFVTNCNLETPPFPGAPFTIPDFASCAGAGFTEFAVTTDANVLFEDLVAAGVFTPNNVPGQPGVLPDGTDFRSFLENVVGASLPPGVNVYPILNAVDPAAGVILDFGAGQNLSTSDSWREPTYRIGIEFDAAEDSLIYATFETGYRAGGVELGAASDGTSRLSFDPEFIDAFAVGSKNRFFNDTLQVNAELFYWEYTDQQVSYFSTRNSAPTFSTANGDSTIQGVDLDVLWAATDVTTIGAKFQYLDSVFDELVLESDPATGRYGCDDRGVSPATGLQTFDCSGTQLLFSPEIAIDLSLQQVFALSDDLKLTGFVDVSYRDEQEVDLAFLSETVADSYVMLNLQATLSSEKSGWELSVFSNNVTDERFLVNTSIGTPAILHGQYNPPRTYGLRLRAEF